MQENRRFNERILNVDGSSVFFARGQSILHQNMADSTAQVVGTLPVPLWQSVISRSHMLARLLRLGVHHLLSTGNGLVAVANRATFYVNDGECRYLSALHGSRPLVLAQSGNSVFYGEYRSNPGRYPVHIWRWRERSADWEIAWTFTGVRHIHGVFHDAYTGYLWVTTGDDDGESAIWCSENEFSTLKKVIGGCQQFRSVQLLFTGDFVYFGSDAPNERNHLYRMRRDGQALEKLATVSSSVFYGCKVGESLFFSTAVEPSYVNTTGLVEVWRSDDGEKWYSFLTYKKDCWSMKYFQYGQVFFPSGPGDGKHLYVTPFATEEHGRTLVYRIK